MSVKERFQVNTETGTSWVEICDRKQPHTSNVVGTPVARVVDFQMAEMLASELNLRGWVIEGQPASKGPTAEAEVVINGRVLGSAEACTLRMALNHFICSLNAQHPLTDDAHYSAIRALYKSSANDVLRIMHGE